MRANLITHNIASAILIVIVFLLTACGGSSQVSPPPDTVVTATKWHPGHYVLVPPNLSDLTALENTLIAIQDIPEFKGVQVRVNWVELEPSQGVYNADLINNALNLVQQYNKRLVLQIMERCWNCVASAIVPAYITSDAKYSGGVFSPNGNDQYTRIFDASVMTEFNNMISWLGNNYDSHPRLEAINFPETAYPCSSNTDCIEPAHTNAVIQRFINAKQYFPTTNIIQYANWINTPEVGKTPAMVLSEIMDSAKEHTVGWGGPDILPYDAPGKTTYNQVIPAYSLYSVNADDIPLGASVQASAMNGRQGIFTAQELFEKAVDDLKLNYVFWIGLEGSANYPGLLNDVAPPTAGQVHQSIIDSGITQETIDAMPSISILSYLQSQNARISDACPGLITHCSSE